jgi:uncharacterized protein YecE (DUF72 family)
MTRICLGLPALQGDLRTYQKRFDLVELRPVDASLPKVSKLRAWRKSVPPTFVFSVVLPRIVGELVGGEAADAALAQALEVAGAVEARAIVLATPPSIRPTQANRKRVAALLERIPREGVAVCWEPSGMWEVDEIAALAKSVRAVPVLDAARDALPPGSIVYTRLRALGSSSAVSAAAIERIAERLRGRREAFVVVEGKGDAGRVKAGLASALGRAPAKGPSAPLVRPSAGLLIAEDEEQ